MVSAQISFYLNTQSMTRKFFFIIDQMNARGMNFNSVLHVQKSVICLWKISEKRHLCSPIFKDTILTVFQSNQTLCQHGDSVFFTDHHISLQRYWTGLYLINIFHTLTSPFYPFTAEAAIPAINCFWKNR